MRDDLPEKSQETECGIVNLDDSSNTGTHWVCYYNKPNEALYFDSYGFAPPSELEKYLKNDVVYSSFDIQRELMGPICGHLCLHVLFKLNEGKKFLDILLNLIDHI